MISPPSALLGYRRREGVFASLYDEFLGSDGILKPHWKEVSDYFSHLGAEEINRRWNRAQRILLENGVAYNQGGIDRQGPLRSWELNPIPLRISRQEWVGIDRAVRQRGRLMNHILEDLYGSQRLIQERLIPPALVYGSRSWLRSCVGVPVTKQARLTLYAVDLARSPDGAWWVLSDRAQAPSGAGYALENRIVLSRVFPEVFRTVNIARLGGFFRTMKESLESLSPRSGEEPHIVLLTPGPLNETYFEQAYMARHLGLELVEGQDLTVRENIVYIRTLKGLKRVDVIVRRVDDDYCDPLEFRNESLLGVPGLMNAVRAGSVTLANSLGSGLVQTSTLEPYLSKISESLLGEKLLMPSVATWWCGQSSAKDYVLNNLNRLVVQPAFDVPGDFPKEIDDIESLKAQILQRPEMFAAKEFVRLSQCPDFREGRLEPRSVVLRVFAVRCGDDYRVMPGGLTRVADNESSHGALIKQSGGSKDTWVDDEEEKPSTSTAVQIQTLSPRPKRIDSSLTSRTVDNLFWFGRYAERGEFTTRVMRTILEGLSGHHGSLSIEYLKPLVRTLIHFGQISPHTLDLKSLDELRATIVFRMLDRSFSGTLIDVVDRLREVVTTIRDQVTNDTWWIANQLPYLLQSHSDDKGSRGEMDLKLNQVLLHFSALNGVIVENRTHDFGWRFIDLGRRIERSLYSARIVSEFSFHRFIHKDQSDGILFQTLLDVFDAGIAYHDKYNEVHRETVLELLLCDEVNPRSLVGQLSRILDHLLNIPRDQDESYKVPEERLLLKTLNDVRLIDSKKLTPKTLGNIESAMAELSSLISRRFFTHLRTSSIGQDLSTNISETV
jgi:uncharacterized circularly permuted ATP-grasp superfamily protein/uncharacterized alpha-E superfamily protein